MKTKEMRKIIRINEDKCNGCGSCIDSCAEGALALIDGKARLVKEKYCDGLAACLKECPQGALSIEEREAEAFDQDAAVLHAQSQTKDKNAPCACPGSAVRQFEKTPVVTETASQQESTLSHWPVQLSLVPPGAPFLADADLLLTAHCVPVAYPNLHRDFLEGRKIVIACSKLDDAEAHLEKLTAILSQNTIRSLTVLRMEVPCCSGLTRIARLAAAQSGRDLPVKEMVIGIRGDVRSS